MTIKSILFISIVMLSPIALVYGNPTGNTDKPANSGTASNSSSEANQTILLGLEARKHVIRQVTGTTPGGIVQLQVARALTLLDQAAQPRQEANIHNTAAQGAVLPGAHRAQLGTP